VPTTTVASLWQHRRSIAELPVKPNCFIVPNRITFSSAAERHIEQGDSQIVSPSHPPPAGILRFSSFYPQSRFVNLFAHQSFVDSKRINPHCDWRGESGRHRSSPVGGCRGRTSPRWMGRAIAAVQDGEAWSDAGRRVQARVEATLQGWGGLP
jgi:hypothetical protein